MHASPCLALEWKGARLGPTAPVQQGLIGALCSPKREQPGCPSLRASSDHRLIVGALRARRTVWLLPLLPPSEAARSGSTGPTRATFHLFTFREHGGLAWPPPSSLSNYFTPTGERW